MAKLNELRISFCMLAANLTIQLNASNEKQMMIRSTQFQLKQYLYALESPFTISDGSQEENFINVIKFLRLMNNWIQNVS